VALFFAYRRIFRAAQDCKPGEVCAVPQVRRAYQVVFWIAAALVPVSAGHDLRRLPVDRQAGVDQGHCGRGAPLDRQAIGRRS